MITVMRRVVCKKLDPNEFGREKYAAARGDYNTIFVGCYSRQIKVPVYSKDTLVYIAYQQSTSKR